MTSIYYVKAGDKKVKKVTLKKLISSINVELYTKKLFINKKDAEKHLKNQNEANKEKK